MKIYRNDDGTFFEITGKGFPYPIDKEKAWDLITNEGYEVENSHFSNDDTLLEIDIDQLQKEIEELQKIKLDEELEITKDWFFYGIDRVKNEFDTYYKWAKETQKSLPEAEFYNESNFCAKSLDIANKVKEGSAYKVGENLYIFKFGGSYVYGHLVPNADYWRFIGVLVKKEYEQELLKVARTDFSIINGVF